MKKKNLIFKVLLLLLIILCGGSVAVMALWDEDKAVHIKAESIENSTLAVGAHLIYLGSLTQEIYDEAMKSAGESGQVRVYYKSELAEGTWFDITSASVLDDITTAGSPVDKKVIEELFFTHHTKSDGVTYDLRTGRPVSIYDINPPYDLESWPELMPLKNYYDLMKETQADSKEGKKKIKRMEEVFKTEIVSETTLECDKILAALNVYNNVLSDNDGGDAEMSVVQKAMSAMDSSRRALVFQIMEDVLNDYAEELQSVSDSKDEEGNVTEEGSSSDVNLQAAVNDSLLNVSNAVIESQGKMLNKGVTVMSETEYLYYTKLCVDAVASNHSACDEDVSILICLSNILNGVVANKESELGYLDGILLPKGSTKFNSALSAGENAEYKSAAGSNSASVLLRQIANTSAAQTDSIRGEYEFFIEAKAMRLPIMDALKYIDGLLAEAPNLYRLPKNDAFKAGSDSSVETHIGFLTRLRRQYELASGGNELDKLLAEKGDSQTKLMSCLDKNDLAGAKQAESEIAALDEKIDAYVNDQANKMSEMQSDLKDLNDQFDKALSDNGLDRNSLPEDTSGLPKKVVDLLNKVNAAETELAKAQGGLSDGTIGKMISDIKKECLDIIGDPNTTNEGILKLNIGIDTLGNMIDQNYKIIFPALKDIHKAMVSERDLNDNVSFGGSIDKVEDYILNNSVSYAAAVREEKTDADLLKIAKEYLDSLEVGTEGGIGLDGRSALGSGSAGSTGLDGIGNGSGTAGTGTGADGTGAGAGETGTDETGTGAGETGTDGTGTDGTGTGTGETVSIPLLPSFQIGGIGAGGTGTDGTGTDGTGAGVTGAGTDGTGVGVTGAGTDGTGAVGAGGTAGGDDGSDLSDDEKQVVLLAALDMLAKETGSDSAKQLLAVEVQNQANLGNPLVFQSMSDESGEFIPVRVLGDYLGMRYVWINNQDRATLAQGSQYYAFTNYSREVIVGKKEPVTVQTISPAIKQGELYIHDAYSYSEFGVESVNITGSAYGVVTSDRLKGFSEELFGLLLD